MSECVCVLDVGCGCWRLERSSHPNSYVPILRALFFHFFFYSFHLGSLEEFGSISLMILNGAAVAVCGLLVCRRWGDGAAELHSTSLGPGLPSWSHIKEQPCLSTCAGWSPFRFPLCWSSLTFQMHPHIHKM